MLMQPLLFFSCQRTRGLHPRSKQYATLMAQSCDHLIYSKRYRYALGVSIAYRWLVLPTRLSIIACGYADEGR